MNFLQCINREITARESYKFLKNEKGKKKDSFSKKSLHSGGKLSHTQKCVKWCSGYHYCTTSFRFCAGSNPACGVSEIQDGKDL